MPRAESRSGQNQALNAFVLAPELFVIKPWSGSLALMGDWVLIAVSLVCAAIWPHPLVYLLAALIIARSQLALAVIMHESAHGVLLRQQRLNDWCGQLLAAGPLFLSLQTYRAGHLKHHLRPMEQDDPVIAVFGLGDYPLPRSRLALRLLADLTGAGYCISAFKFARGDYRAIMPRVDKSAHLKQWEVASMLLINGVLFGVLYWSGHPWLYAGLWLLPAITLLPLMGRVRAILEHAGFAPNADQSQNARSIVRPSWQTFFFGPHAVHYHIEHHLYVRMPFYHLPSAHRQLAAHKLLPAGNLYSGYGRVLRDVSYPSQH
ncbi:fatty acid desaturase family protein [Pseudomonas sp. CDFA 602]|uniref:fatty acid desaturase family protein n=1 Tax=Pseudomonas californiensis TaxID=2829823 RepID=UPI001E4171C8|nr:fatty acid desaturase family protein [Pseudomonas californiensis]MCD5996363.1 fatty acid desaturase family protein [Pseudomonas californiensis]MCD6001962.1 fatty acid desaturase family protein [Pseudomonas californiensis]